MLKLFTLIFFNPIAASKSELNCRVIVNAEAIQSSDPATITEMEIAFSEFLNNTKWTSDLFKVEERINCNIIITLNDQSDRTRKVPSFRTGALLQTYLQY